MTQDQFVSGFAENTISWLSQCYVGPSLIFKILNNWQPSDVGHQTTVLIGSCGWSRSDAKAEQNLQKAIPLKDVHAIDAAPGWSRGELKKVYENLKAKNSGELLLSGTRWQPCRLAFAHHRCMCLVYHQVRSITRGGILSIFSCMNLFCQHTLDDGSELGFPMTCN